MAVLGGAAAAVPRRGTFKKKWAKSGWPAEGLWGYQEGQMGQNLPLCGQLRPTRSRQDESKEVGGVGSKRASSGGNGGHHVWWGGLVSRLLPCPGPRAQKMELLNSSGRRPHFSGLGIRHLVVSSQPPLVCGAATWPRPGSSVCAWSSAEYVICAICFCFWVVLLRGEDLCVPSSSAVQCAL
jgi:hypothetical protein